MHLLQVDLALAGARAALDFYRERLQVPVDGERVQVGETVLRLRQDDRAAGSPHLAFDIPAPRFEPARNWLAARVALSSDAAGRTEIEGPPHWNSRSVYFEGGGGEILELIARRDRPSPAVAGDFSPAELLSISEVGVAVDRPLEAAAELRRLGIDPYGEPVASFAPCGDLWGLLILVSPERPWFPTPDRLATPGPLRIHARTGRPGTHHLGPLADLTTT